MRAGRENAAPRPAPAAQAGGRSRQDDKNEGVARSGSLGRCPRPGQAGWRCSGGHTMRDIDSGPGRAPAPGSKARVPIGQQEPGGDWVERPLGRVTAAPPVFALIGLCRGRRDQEPGLVVRPRCSAGCALGRRGAQVVLLGRTGGRTDPERCGTCCGDHGGSCGRLEFREAKHLDMLVRERPSCKRAPRRRSREDGRQPTEKGRNPRLLSGTER
ncbi:uncharacterized protein LOC109284327 isoform X2 [Alligator mississippiensis]|nr:uncharacterized protein LOC109284327 isoform X2 [Alligator mississippiensis]